MVPRFDEHSFRQLFNDHFTGLCRFASGYVKDYETAREIVQDSYVNLWEKREMIDLSRPVKSYLSTSVRNRCLNYLRDHKKFSDDLLALENLSEEDLWGQRDPVVEAEIRDRISQALAELPQKCREVFTLSRNRNLKYQQIAGELGISVKTVETQMSKALRHMRIRLAEYLPLLIPGLLFMNDNLFWILSSG